MDSFNSVFDSCNPDENDKVEYNLLLDDLTLRSMNSCDEEKSTKLKMVIDDLFRNQEGSKISRRDFLKCLMAEEFENKQNSIQSHESCRFLSPIVTYEYKGRKSDSWETVELQDLERSISSSVDSTPPRTKEMCLHLIKMGTHKDRKISKLEKENEELRQEILSSTDNEAALESSYKKKIENLREQLRDVNENYVLCCKKADTLDNVEYELNKRIQQKKTLEKQIVSLQGDLKKALNEMNSLDNKMKSLETENKRLHDKLADEETLYMKMEQLRSEKLELQEKLVNCSVSMCPNLVHVSDEEDSPDRMLLSYPPRERAMSLDQELRLVCSMNGCPEGVETEDKSTSCWDLVELVSDVSPPRKIQTIGTQTPDDHRDDLKDQGLSERTCVSCLLLPVNNAEVSTQTETQTENMEADSPEIPTSPASISNHSPLSCSSFHDSRSSLSSTISSNGKHILSVIVPIVILLACALVFFTHVFNLDVLIGPICKWIAHQFRNNVKYQYIRGMPPH